MKKKPCCYWAIWCQRIIDFNTVTLFFTHFTVYCMLFPLYKHYTVLTHSCENWFSTIFYCFFFEIETHFSIIFLLHVKNSRFGFFSFFFLKAVHKSLRCWKLLLYFTHGKLEIFTEWFDWVWVVSCFTFQICGDDYSKQIKLHHSNDNYTVSLIKFGQMENKNRKTLYTFFYYTHTNWFPAL